MQPLSIWEDIRTPVKSGLAVSWSMNVFAPASPPGVCGVPLGAAAAGAAFSGGGFPALAAKRLFMGVGFLSFSRSLTRCGGGVGGGGMAGGEVWVVM